ncbi:hypothetical protein H2200_004995 [Cladophialophora chaetospira]|uniref:Uncharacterized protein n=1 Tax=Cladophialophora chaetospira TaxID=386627 RepID=A0AA38XB41_9EURO|nr:hypothetical protein H2200_004995 [Cladophialophora chaetospira]
MSADLTEYPVSACNTTCPADPTEKCGGKVSTSSSPSRFLRRQITNANGDTILLTLYNNTAAAEIGGSSTSAMMTTSSGAMTGGPGLGSMTSSNVNGGGSASFSTPAPPLVSSTTGAGAPAGSTSFSGANTDDANLGSMSTTSTIAGTFPSSTSGVDVSAILTSFPSSSSSSLSSSSLSPIVISTTYTTICALDPIICPTRTETCLATTVTVLHCGCTDTPVPEVPMTTTVVEACPTAPAQHAQAGGAAGGNNVGNGQEGNAAPMTTLTVPCASAISSLEASVTSWSASASAQASAAAHAEAAAGAAHPNVPYTSAVETQTLNLVIATAPFNFSVPSVPAPSNGSWVGEVKNMTIVPVALTAMAGAAGSAVAGASAAASAMAGFKSEGSCVRGWSGERGALLVGFALLLGVMGLGL